MSDADIAINEIKALEDRRYRAMIDGDTAVLDELCSDDLIYTHSKGDHDDKRSYIHKVGSRYFDRPPLSGPGGMLV
jgi:ketosteroid isomerase-like protein